MIPDLVNGVLPPGVHSASPSELVEAFGWTDHRRSLISGFKRGVSELRRGGCRDVWLDGSFVTDKEIPGDFDACWDPTGVDLGSLDPVLLDLRGERIAQKAKYGGEFFPNIIESSTGLFFVEFFQRDRDGNPKGIVYANAEEWG